MQQILHMVGEFIWPILYWIGERFSDSKGFWPWAEKNSGFLSFLALMAAFAIAAHEYFQLKKEKERSTFSIKKKNLMILKSKALYLEMLLVEVKDSVQKAIKIDDKDIKTRIRQDKIIHIPIIDMLQDNGRHAEDYMIRSNHFNIISTLKMRYNLLFNYTKDKEGYILVLGTIEERVEHLLEEAREGLTVYINDNFPKISRKIIEEI